MPRINGDRLLADLRRLAQFGQYKTGVDRPTFSPVDMESRHWLADRMREAGLEAVIDGVGNVIGRDKGPRRARLLMGSHSETQPRAGWLDGALGVIFGLEMARAFAEDPGCAGFGIDTAAWADEEGHFSNYLGSRSFTGALDPAELDTGRSRAGVTLRDALAGAGLAGRPREAIDPQRYVGYLEAHIEQGDTLDLEGLRIGIVESIVGIWNYRVAFDGQQNHAGTTRMKTRKDAGVAMVKLAARIHEEFPTVVGPRTVWTIGRMILDPNAPSIVPGHAEMQVQFRDAEAARLPQIEALLHRLVAEADKAGPCRCTIETISRSEPRLMDSAFQTQIEASAEQHAPGLHLRMPSGAGHDAQILSHRLRAGMMFIPSIGGISHHYAEDTKPDDIVLGAQVFADAAERILRAA